jgi:hypothetical protein
VGLTSLGPEDKASRALQLRGRGPVEKVPVKYDAFCDEGLVLNGARATRGYLGMYRRDNANLRSYG